jgi:hypothetical protein
MDSQDKFKPEDVERVWYHYLTYGDVPDFLNPPWYKSKNLRPLYRRLPTEPRCLSCYYPFSGFGGKLLRGLFNIRPSRLILTCAMSVMNLHQNLVVAQRSI